MHATLIGRWWLWRKLRVELPEGEYTVIYSGWGMGHETVYVDDHIAERAANMSLNPVGFVPVFVFPIGRRLGTVEIRVWPWTAIRSFHLIVDGEAIYAEGERSPKFLPPAWVEDLRQRWEGTGRVNPEITAKLSRLIESERGVTRPDDRSRRGGD